MSILRHRPACLIPLLLLAHHVAIRGQALGPERQDINDLRGDIWSVWTSPAHFDRGDILPVAGAVASAATLSVLADSAIYAWMQNHPKAPVMRLLTPTRENWKLPLYEFGSGQVLLPVSGALYVAGRLSHSVGLRDAGLGCAAGHLSSAGLREIMYLLVGRERPRVTPDPDEFSFPGGLTWDDQSFLSGHVANSMACASFLSHRFKLGLGGPAMYTFVTAIGFGRAADGRHWPSDLFSGAILGYTIGKALSDRQRAREAGRASAESQIGASASTLPILHWSFQF